MAFLEQLGKKITDAGQGVAQQTKNLADIARLNSSISDKEKRIANLYSEIGKAYYEHHRNDSVAEEAAGIGEINSLFAEIEQHIWILAAAVLCKLQFKIRFSAGKMPCGHPNSGAYAAMNNERKRLL